MKLSIESIVLWGFISIFCFICSDMFINDKKELSGIIIDKHYKAEINSRGLGYGTSVNGKSGLIMTSQHESEKFLIMVQTIDGEIFTVESDSKTYYGNELGENITFLGCYGWATGYPWIYTSN